MSLKAMSCLRRSAFHPKRLVCVAIFGLFSFFLLNHRIMQPSANNGDGYNVGNMDILVNIQFKLKEIAEQEARNYVSRENIGSPCATYHQAAAMTRHALNDVTNSRLYFNTADDSVTMVTQMSDERLDKLHMIMEYWTGPISVAVYIKEDNLKDFISRLQQRSNLLVHLVRASGPYYPVNYLRNVALEASVTKFVFLNDIDFIPPPNSYERILEHARTLKKHTVIVVPAFEEIRAETRLRHHFPTTKANLVNLWYQNKTQPFHLHVFEPGQAPTNPHKWANTTDPYKIQWSRWYEPCVVAHADELPRFNEQLVGRYENKALHIAEMKARGFNFIVNPEVFLLHLWHPVIPLNKTIYNCSVSVSRPYTKYLETTYNVILT